MPLGVVTEHGVECYNHLAHGDDDDFGLFASGGEAIGSLPAREMLIAAE
jgi:hypothetical protein